MDTKLSNKPITELEDVAVETLGLVSQGANREEFFLLKDAKNSNPTTEIVATPGLITETVTEQLAVTFWQKLIKALKEALVTPQAEPVTTEADQASQAAVPATSPPVTKQSIAETANVPTKEAEMLDVASEVDTDSTSPKVCKEVEAITSTVGETANLDTIDTLAKTVVAPATNLVVALDATTTSNKGVSHMDEVTISKAEYDALATRLAKTESDLAASREKEERQVWLLKASNLAYVPTATTELTDQLYWLYKADPKRAQYWEDTLTALNNMVQDSQMFVEKGTKQMPTEGLDAVLKSPDPRAALKNLSRADAEAYLKAARKGGR